MEPTSLERKIASMGPWQQNLRLPDGTETAPGLRTASEMTHHWKKISQFLPEDLRGWSALEIGCNAGFYSFELARRGAQVTGIDMDCLPLKQARWMSAQLLLKNQVTFKQRPIYDLVRSRRKFDIVFFLGGFEHLRYPLLAVDIISEITRRILVFKTLTMPGEEVYNPAKDISLDTPEIFSIPGWPRLAFVEKGWKDNRRAWWACNHAAIEALLRSSGFDEIRRVTDETYLARPVEKATRLQHPPFWEELQAATLARTFHSRRKDTPEAALEPPQTGEPDLF